MAEALEVIGAQCWQSPRVVMTRGGWALMTLVMVASVAASATRPAAVQLPSDMPRTWSTGARLDLSELSDLSPDSEPGG